MSNELEKAIRYFKNMRDDNKVVLDSGFGTEKGESNLLYKNRKKYAELAIEALEKQIAKKPTVLINDKDVKIGCVTFRKGVKTYKCNCGCWVTLSQDYCSQCGQKLYWNEVD